VQQPRFSAVTTNLPDLNRLFFDRNDTGDHAADSCCLALHWAGFANEKSKWVEVRDEHLEALRVLARYAAQEATGGQHSGWLLGRPLVFAAHHTSELALKTQLLDDRAHWPKGSAGHDLEQLLALDRKVHGARAASQAWEDQFVQLLERACEAGRYPDSRSSGPLFDQWCCVSANELVTAVATFASLVGK